MHALASILRDARKGALLQRRAQLRSRGDEVGDIYSQPPSRTNDDAMTTGIVVAGRRLRSPRCAVKKCRIR
jgi:hypothetical protein